MTKNELSFKILVRLNDALNSIVSDGGDEPVWNAVTWIKAESDDAHEYCYQFDEDKGYCYKCRYFDEFGKSSFVFKSFCKLHRFDVRYLYSCPQFQESE